MAKSKPAPEGGDTPTESSGTTSKGGILATFRPVDALIPYARNSRTHTPEQVAQLAASILEFGFTNPVLADTTGIVAGHGRVLAARQLYAAGKTIAAPGGGPMPAGTVPVIDCTGWSEAQRRAYVIADNKLALNAGWDNDMLRVELGDLTAMDFDVAVLGFTADELVDVFADAKAEASAAVNDDRFLVMVDCGDESKQQLLFNELSARGLECKLLS